MIEGRVKACPHSFPKQETLYPETGDFVAENGNKIARFRIQSLLFREQVWTGVYTDVVGRPARCILAYSRTCICYVGVEYRDIAVCLELRTVTAAWNTLQCRSAVTHCTALRGSNI